MRYDVVPGTPGSRGGAEVGVVPHRSYPPVNAPWIPPGNYQVRLTTREKTFTQPITVKMDPRVKMTPAVERIFTLTSQAESEASTAADALKQARDLLAKVKGQNDALAAKIEEIAPEKASADTPSLTDIGGLVIAGGFCLVLQNNRRHLSGLPSPVRRTRSPKITASGSDSCASRAASPCVSPTKLARCDLPRRAA